MKKTLKIRSDKRYFGGTGADSGLTKKLDVETENVAADTKSRTDGFGYSTYSQVRGKEEPSLYIWY